MIITVEKDFYVGIYHWVIVGGFFGGWGMDWLRARTIIVWMGQLLWLTKFILEKRQLLKMTTPLPIPHKF